MGERVKGFSGTRVPNFAIRRRRSARHGTVAVERFSGTHAVKSALPDTAMQVSMDNLVLHTAPL